MISSTAISDVGSNKDFVEVLFQQELSSSEDPPIEEWSSLIFETVEPNVKVLRAREGLYDPGSGELCGKLVAFSTSSVIRRHPYYNYPAITDPGISQALFLPPYKLIYSDDGQELYLDLCKEMNIPPIRKFYKELLEDTIDLKYYGIRFAGFRPMAIALKLNTLVKVLDLTDNWINDDGCYHLGDMLLSNCTLTELNLNGCRIGPNGARLLLNNLHLNRALRVLNLARNELSDEGAAHLTAAIFKGADLTEINLSRNNLTAKFVNELVVVFETYNKVTHLDLSFNFIISPLAVFRLCESLSMNRKFQELDLSWNALFGERIGNGLSMLIKHPNLRRLRLRNNRLEGAPIAAIAFSLRRAPKLELLDLSNNPLTHVDALCLLSRFKERRVKLKELRLENVCVSETFEKTLQYVKKLKSRHDTVIVHGDVMTKLEPVGKDLREIVMDRVNYFSNRRKKTPHFALVAQELGLENEQVDPKNFRTACLSLGLYVDEDIVTLISQLFPGERSGKGRMIDMALLVDYVKRKWPDKKLPPPKPPRPPSVHAELKRKDKGKKK